MIYKKHQQGGVGSQWLQKFRAWGFSCLFVYSQYGWQRVELGFGSGRGMYTLEIYPIRPDLFNKTGQKTQMGHDLFIKRVTQQTFNKRVKRVEYDQPIGL